jgi:hypothetical protein
VQNKNGELDSNQNQRDSQQSNEMKKKMGVASTSMWSYRTKAAEVISFQSNINQHLQNPNEFGPSPYSSRAVTSQMGSA